MNDLDWRDRHRLTTLLTTYYPDRRRLAAVAATAGLELPPPRGFEPLFSAASQLVLTGGSKLEGLVQAAAATHEEFSSFLPPPPLSDEDTAPTEMMETVDEEPTVPPTVEEAPEGVAPRPVGTPAQAPSLDGVETWVARHIEWEAPEALAAGEPQPLTLTFRAPDGEAVGGAPAGHTAYVGEAFPVDVEVVIEGGDAEETRQTVRVDPIVKSSAVTFVVTPSPGAEALSVVLRCYSGGFEVGRGRFEAGLPTGERSSGGALAVPDSVLEQINEDAIKTVQEG